jgi:hypothetical protein
MDSEMWIAFACIAFISLACLAMGGQL